MKIKQTNIEWADYTFNPWRGCTKISEGCAHCYAETLSLRNPAVLGQWGKGKPRVLAADAMWHSPIKWNEDAFRAIEHVRHRPRVFCASLADWLDDEVPLSYLERLLFIIMLTPHLDWLLLTKRPQLWNVRIAGVLDLTNDKPLQVWLQNWLNGHAPVNVWLGTSVENQARADERIPLLVNIPARVRFLSCEPLLGYVDLHSAAIKVGCWRVGESWDGPKLLEGIHWVIAGGESGPNARPMFPNWVRSIRDQCQAADVAFLFKQWGEWLATDTVPLGSPLRTMPCKATGYVDFEGRLWSVAEAPCSAYLVRCLGKKKAGRELDGRTHDAFPTPTL